MDKLVDFSQPIEAYHTDGSVVVAIVRDGKPYPANGCYWVTSAVFSNWVMPGTDLMGNGWRVRNIISAKPSTPSNEELTQRMEGQSDFMRAAGEEAIAILRHMLAHDNSGHSWELPRDVQKRALSFISDLPKPVDPIDPDLVLARRVVADEYERGNMPGLAERALAGEMDGRMRVRAARSAIKLGRTLAAGGTTHE